MKLLFDQNLSPALAVRLGDGFPGSMHVRDAGMQSAPDEQVWRYALENGLAIVTKDSDFYYSHMLHGKPAKLLLVRAGNLRLRDLLKLFEAHLPESVSALENNSLVEIDRSRITIHD